MYGHLGFLKVPIRLFRRTILGKGKETWPLGAWWRKKVPPFTCFCTNCERACDSCWVKKGLPVLLFLQAGVMWEQAGVYRLLTLRTGYWPTTLFSYDIFSWKGLGTDLWKEGQDNYPGNVKISLLYGPLFINGSWSVLLTDVCLI